MEQGLIMKLQKEITGRNQSRDTTTCYTAELPWDTIIASGGLKCISADGRGNDLGKNRAKVLTHFPKYSKGNS